MKAFLPSPLEPGGPLSPGGPCSPGGPLGPGGPLSPLGPGGPGGPGGPAGPVTMCGGGLAVCAKALGRGSTIWKPWIGKTGLLDPGGKKSF